MVQINIKIVICCTMLAIAACNSTKQLHEPQNSWKEQWFSMFMDRYPGYKYRRATICPGDNRDYFYDFARKIQSIVEYPFDEVFDSIQFYAKKNKIKFDSINIINISQSEDETIDYSCPSTFVVFHLKNRVKIVSLQLDWCEKVISVSEFEDTEIIEKFLKTDFKDGCDFGYVTYTKVDSAWKYKIQKIVINPE